MPSEKFLMLSTFVAVVITTFECVFLQMTV